MPQIARHPQNRACILQNGDAIGQRFAAKRRKRKRYAVFSSQSAEILPARNGERKKGRPQALFQMQIVCLLQLQTQVVHICFRQLFCVHLAGSIGQLVRFIHHQRLITSKQKWLIFHAVCSIGQQVIVVANLDIGLHGISQILLIAAIQTHETISRAGPRHRDSAAVIPGKLRNMIHVQNVRSNVQAVGLPFSAWLHQRCSFGKAGIADKTLFALADNSCDGCGDDTLVQQDSGQVGQILSKDSVLQGNAGSGDNDRQFHPFGAMHLPKDTAHEVSQRFAGAYACFAQGNFLII